MSHAKYLSSSPCVFGEEDFLLLYMYIRKSNDPQGLANFDPYWFRRRRFLSFFFRLPWQPKFYMEFRSLNNFEIALYQKHPHQVLSNLAKWFRKKRRFNEKSLRTD